MSPIIAEKSDRLQVNRMFEFAVDGFLDFGLDGTASSLI